MSASTFVVCIGVSTTLLKGELDLLLGEVLPQILVVLEE